MNVKTFLWLWLPRHAEVAPQHCSATKTQKCVKSWSIFNNFDFGKTQIVIVRETLRTSEKDPFSKHCKSSIYTYP